MQAWLTCAKPVAMTTPAPKQRATNSAAGKRPRLSSGSDTPMADVARMANRPAMRSSRPAEVSPCMGVPQVVAWDVRADMVSAPFRDCRRGHCGWLSLLRCHCCGCRPELLVSGSEARDQACCFCITVLRQTWGFLLQLIMLEAQHI